MGKLGLIATAAIVVTAFGLSTTTTTPASAQSRPAANQAAPMAKFTAKKAMPDQNVTNLQTALNKNGANVKIDGMMGPQTRSALRRYQQNNNLKVRGSADSARRAKLGV